MYDAPFNPFYQNVGIIKNYFKKPIVLILAILQFVSLIGSAIVTFALPSWLTPLMEMANSELPSEYRQILSFSSSSSIVSFIPSLALGVLLGVAYLLVFIKSKNDNPNASPKAGFMILFILSIIELVSSIIACAVLVLIFFILIIALGASGMLSSSEGIAGVAAIIMVAVIYAFLIFFLLFYSINKLNYFKSVKNSLSSIELQNKGAGAYGVINMIMAVFVALYTIILIFIAFMLGGANPISRELVRLYPNVSLSSMLPILIVLIAMMLISVVFMVLSAILALGYKKYINNIKYNYRAPSIPEQPYQPNPVTAQMPQPVYPSPAQPFVPQDPQQPVPSQQDFASPQEPYPQNSTELPRYNASDIDFIVPEEIDSYSCPTCGNPVDFDAFFCPKCGTKLK